MRACICGELYIFVHAERRSIWIRAQGWSRVERTSTVGTDGWYAGVLEPCSHTGSRWAADMEKLGALDHGSLCGMRSGGALWTARRAWSMLRSLG